MKLTSRTLGIRPTLIRQITNRARPTSLHLGLGQPDLPVSEAATRALAETSHTPYTPNRGLPELVDAVGARYPGRGVIVTAGVQEALAVAMLGLVEGGDVLVPDPGFPAYPNLVRLAGARPVPYRLGERWALDATAIDEAWTDETVAIVINTPSNPTGAVAKPADLRAVVELAEERGAVWISDEIYEDFVWSTVATGSGPALSHVSAASCGARGVVVSGLSKSHSAMGLRVGWLAGPADVVDGLVPLHQHLVTCAPTPSQRAAIAMLGEHDTSVERVRASIGKRRALALESIERWGTTQPVADGAFYLFVDMRPFLRAGETDLDLANAILDEIDVVTIPGSGFGKGGEGFLRLAYTVDEGILGEAFGRLEAFLQSRLPPHRRTE